MNEAKIDKSEFEVAVDQVMKRLNAVEKLVGMDREKEGSEFSYSAVEDANNPSKTPIGAWRDELVKKAKRDFFAEYEAAQEAEYEADQAEVEARTWSADALNHLRALEAKGFELGWLRE